MASRSLGQLTVDLVAKVGGFEQGMDKAARSADKRLSDIERRAKIAGAAIGGALTTAYTVVANELRRTINQMDELSKAAQRANMPTEAFTKFAYAAELADVSIQDLQSAMGRLAKAQGDAEKATSTQARIFEALGIATKDAEGNLRSTEEVFLDFADAFQRFKGDPEILAAGMQIFGRSFQTLIPLLKDGSAGLRTAGEEAEALGLIFSDEAGAQAEQFNDDLSRLKGALRGVWVEVAQQVLPQLTELTGQFVQAAKEGDLIKNTADQIAEALRGVADTAKFFFNLIDALSQVRGWLVQIEQTASKFSLGGLAGIGDQVRNILPDWLYATPGAPRAVTPRAPTTPVREMDPTLGAPLSPAEIEAQRRRLRGALGDAPKSGGAKKQREEVNQLDRAYQSLNERLNEQIALFDKTGEAARLSYELENGALKDLDATRKQELLTLAERFDAMTNRREADEAAYRLAQQETEEIKARQENLNSLISDMEFELALIGMTNKERERAIALRYANVDAMSEEGQRITALTDAIQRASQAEEYWQGVQRDLSDTFYDFATGAKSARDALGDFLDALYSSSVSAAADYFSEQISNIFKNSGNQSGDNGGGWSDLFSWIGGIFAGGKASGGWASPNRMYEVNERGLEMATVGGRDYLLTGGAGAMITPAGQWGGGNITQQFYTMGRETRETSEQKALYAGREAERALYRTGGR